MGMRDEITQGLIEAFDDPDGLADTVKEFTGVRQGEPVYNPETGEVTATPLTYSGRGIFGQYKNEDVDGTRIQATDTRLLIVQAELSATPKQADLINGLAVVAVGGDPADATWVVQLRG